jgi:hypothetical protein
MPEKEINRVSLKQARDTGKNVFPSPSLILGKE